MKKQIRVYLRALEPDDYLKLHQWRQDEEYMGFYRGVIRYSSSLNEQQWVQQRINDKDSVTCAICMRDTHEFIGCTFLNNIDLINRSARGGTFIGERSQRGKGYGLDARLIMLKHAFYDWGLNRVWAQIHESNKASLSMHVKCGYKQEGLLRNASLKNGTYENLVVMAVLRDEFEEVIKDYDIQ